MADSTISGLPAGVTPTGVELFPVVQSGVTVKLLLSQVLTYISANISGSTPNFSDFETPTGAINGANRTFTVSNSPKSTTSITGYVRMGGVGAFIPMVPGVDFTIVTATKIITTTSTFPTGTNFYVSYRY